MDAASHDRPTVGSYMSDKTSSSSVCTQNKENDHMELKLLAEKNNKRRNYISEDRQSQDSGGLTRKKGV